MINLCEFTEKWRGKFVEADGSSPNSPTYRQCVDVVKQWEIENGWKKITRGNAIDYANNADGQFYKFEKNTPRGVPALGSIIIFSGGKWGHVGIVLAANVRAVAVFSQNYPIGDVCSTRWFNYITPRCIGWLTYIGP